MTCAVFEAHVREIERIKALRALMDADVAMIPHVSTFARKQWFTSITKTLMPGILKNETITFNGRKIGFDQLKKQFGRITKRNKAESVA